VIFKKLLKPKVFFITGLLCLFSASWVFPEQLEVTVENAILIALENNQSLKIQRVAPQIYKTLEDNQEAVFDPVLSGGANYSRVRGKAGAVPVHPMTVRVLIQILKPGFPSFFHMARMLRLKFPWILPGQVCTAINLIPESVLV